MIKRHTTNHMSVFSKKSVSGRGSSPLSYVIHPRDSRSRPNNKWFGSPVSSFNFPYPHIQSAEIEGCSSYHKGNKGRDTFLPLLVIQSRYVWPPCVQSLGRFKVVGYHQVKVQRGEGFSHHTRGQKVLDGVWLQSYCVRKLGPKSMSQMPVAKPKGTRYRV